MRFGLQLGNCMIHIQNKKWIIIILAGFELILSVRCGCWTEYEWSKCSNLTNLEFDITSNIRFLYIENLTYIFTLPRSVFSKFDRLQELHVKSSSIQNIVPGAFDGLSSVRSINLEGNNLSSIKQGIFTSLTELQDLNLAYNRIKSIANDAFIGTKLQSVNLTGNNMSVLGDWPRFLPHLKTLDLSFNNLTEMGYFYPGLQNLNISRNSISKLGDTLSLYHDLKVLDISYNLIEQIGDFFPNLSMEILRLDHNKFARLHLPSAVTVDVSSNNLIEWNFQGIIKEFYLKQNHLESLKGILSRGVWLFDASENSIKLIEDEFFSNSDEMHKLNLRSNKLSLLPLQFAKNLSQLTDLDLSNNEFVSFSFGLFDGLINLQTLNLSTNKLTVIPPSLHSLKRLMYLDIQRNEITKFDYSLMGMNSQLRKVNINENRWNCVYLLQVLQAQRIQNYFVLGNYFTGSNIMGIKCSEDDQSSSTLTQFDKPGSNISWENFINNDFRKSTFYKFFNENFSNTNFVKFYENFNNKISDKSSTQTNHKLEDELIPKIEKLTNIMEQLNSNTEPFVNEKITHDYKTEISRNDISGIQLKLESAKDKESPNNGAFVFIYIILTLNTIMILSLAYIIYKRSKIDQLKRDVQMSEIFNDIS